LQRAQQRQGLYYSTNKTTLTFSDVINNSGICQRVRDKMRVDINQWSNQKIANSCNDYLDEIFVAGIKKDRRFQLDDQNHSKLPIGDISIVSGQSDYSFLTDEQNNKIVTITRIDMKDAQSNWTKLTELDENEEPRALESVVVTGRPDGYYKLADNIIRLNRLPTTELLLRYYFQRTPNYFVSTDTTKEPGVSPLLHKGFVAYAAYDGAETLGLSNLGALSGKMQLERQFMLDYFGLRNSDVKKRITPAQEDNE